MTVTPTYFYIVELDPGLYLADWGGDPGRTYDRAYAQRFEDFDQASAGLFRMRRMRDYPLAVPKAIPTSQVWTLEVQMENGDSRRLPAIGGQHARRLVKDHQGDDCRRIIVWRAGELIAEWVSGRGWSGPALKAAQ